MAGTVKSLQGFQDARETQHILAQFAVHGKCSVISIQVSSGNKILCSKVYGSRLGLLFALAGGGCGNITGFGQYLYCHILTVAVVLSYTLFKLRINVFDCM